MNVFKFWQKFINSKKYEVNNNKGGVGIQSRPWYCCPDD